MTGLHIMRDPRAQLRENKMAELASISPGIEPVWMVQEGMKGREVEEEWDCSETVMGTSGLEQREAGSVSMVSGMQGRGVGDKKATDEGWQRDGSNDVG